MTRCFVAFEFEAGSLAYLREWVEPVHRMLAEEEGWPVRLVRPENWHVTLLFFDGLEAGQRAEVWEEVAAAARSGAWAELAFDWRGLAIWPNPRRPSLICLEAARLSEPVAETGAGTAEWPLPIDREPFSLGKTGNTLAFRPHATLMRFRGRRQRSGLAREWRALRERLPAIEPGRIRFDRVSFLLSTLTQEAPIYPREFTAPLR